LSSVRRPEMDPCWLVWEASERGTFLRAINTGDTGKTSAETHIKMLKVAQKPFLRKSRFYIEKSQLNHLFGVSAILKDKYEREIQQEREVK